MFQTGWFSDNNRMAAERLIPEPSERKLKETNAVQRPAATSPAVQKRRVKEEHRHTG